MNIWIDLANSPHVIFFVPIIQKLKDDGHNIFITMRDFAQTIPLAHKFQLEAEIIGEHGGANRGAKVANLVKRTAQLVTYARGKSIDIAVSHNSYTHVLAGRVCRAKVITIMDYEGQPANHLAFRFAHKVIVPKCFPDAALKKFGASSKKVYKYDGFKEQIYLSDYEPDKTFYDDLISACDLDPELEVSQKVLVTVRTPATMAVYHQFQNPIFDNLLDILNSRDDTLTIVLPRTIEQKEFIKKNFQNLCFPKSPLDGRSLTYHSDIMISAGGTMNREAAILGTPTYSVFYGSVPEVDKELIKTGRMFYIKQPDDLSLIQFKKKPAGLALKNSGIKSEILKEILI